MIEVSIARHGVPSGDSLKQVIADLDPLYPAANATVNRELCQILLALNAPNAVARTVALLQVASTQEEQVTYAVYLRNAKTGWDAELRRTYLSWWNTGRSAEHPAYVTQWFADAGIENFTTLALEHNKDIRVIVQPDRPAGARNSETSQTRRPGRTTQSSATRTRLGRRAPAPAERRASLIERHGLGCHGE